MKKVVHLISSFSRGGRERQLATILKHANNTAFTSEIICFNKRESSYVSEYNLEDRMIYLSSKDTRIRYKEMLKILKEKKPDVMWSWGGFEASFGLRLSKKTGIKHINGSIRHGIVRYNRKQLWRMFILHLTKYRVANSRAGLKANKLKNGFVLYNGIDDSFFVPPNSKSFEVREGLGVKKDELLFVSVANLVPYKDYETIIKSLARIKQDGIKFHHIIIGDGPQREHIEALIQQNQLQDNITILGRRSDVKELLNASDLFIHSSRGEGCSNAILEAMSSGLPVIATSTGGTPEIVTSEFGYLFEFKDADKLYTLIKLMVEDREKLKVMGRMAKDYAIKNFSVKEMINNYEDIIDKVLMN